MLRPSELPMLRRRKEKRGEGRERMFNYMRCLFVRDIVALVFSAG